MNKNVTNTAKMIAKDAPAMPMSEDGAADLYLVGGTWRALAAFARDELGFPLTDPHGFTMNRERASDLIKTLSKTDVEKIKAQPVAHYQAATQKRKPIGQADYEQLLEFGVATAVAGGALLARRRLSLAAAADASDAACAPLHDAAAHRPWRLRCGLPGTAPHLRRRLPKQRVPQLGELRDVLLDAGPLRELRLLVLILDHRDDGLHGALLEGVVLHVKDGDARRLWQT